MDYPLLGVSPKGIQLLAQHRPPQRTFGPSTSAGQDPGQRSAVLPAAGVDSGELADQRAPARRRAGARAGTTSPCRSPSGAQKLGLYFGTGPVRQHAPSDFGSAYWLTPFADRSSSSCSSSARASRTTPSTSRRCPSASSGRRPKARRSVGLRARRSTRRSSGSATSSPRSTPAACGRATPTGDCTSAIRVVRFPLSVAEDGVDPLGPHVRPPERLRRPAGRARLRPVRLPGGRRDARSTTRSSLTTARTPTSRPRRATQSGSEPDDGPAAEPSVQGRHRDRASTSRSTTRRAPPSRRRASPAATRPGCGCTTTTPKRGRASCGSYLRDHEGARQARGDLGYRGVVATEPKVRGHRPAREQRRQEVGQDEGRHGSLSGPGPDRTGRLRRARVRDRARCGRCASTSETG